MAAKVRALQEWCRRQCEGYRDVAITNMTSSWKSGLAFCAIIHRYRPDLIDYESLSKEDVFGNNKLAFDVALQQLGIPALLDPEDMVMMTVPDKLCIVTYVAQYYHYFHSKPQAGGPGVRTATKRASREDAITAVHPSDAVLAPAVKKPLPSTATERVDKHMAERKEPSAVSHRGGTLDDHCHMCHGRVYLLERHYTPAGHLYHRHCYRGYQRSSTLQKSKHYSDKENTDRPSANGSVAKVGVGGLSKDANHIESSGSSGARENRLASSGGVSSAAGNAYSAVISSHSPATSSLSTDLIKALYTPAVYKQIMTSGESLIPTVSNTVGMLRTSAAVTSTLSSALTRSDVVTVTAATTVSTTISCQPGYTAASSQHLHTVSGLNTTAVITSSAAVSTPRFHAGKVASNVMSAAATTMEASSWRLSRPLTSVTVDNSQAAGGPKVTTSDTTASYRMFAGRSAGNVATKTAACVASTSWSSGPSNSPSTSSSTMSGSGGYVSPFLKDRMLIVTATTTGVRPTPATSSYTAVVKSTVLTSQSQVPAVSASYVLDRAARVSTQQQSSAKNSSEHDSAMVNSILQKLAEVRERKQQERQVNYSVIEPSPVQTVVPRCSANNAPVTLSAASRVTENSLATTSNKNEWQLEAERRQAARKGVYIDPEKHPKEVLQQTTHQQQLHGGSYTPTLSQVHRNRVGIETKTHSLSNNTDDNVPDLSTFLKRSKNVTTTAADVSKVSSSRLPTTRRQQPWCSSKKSDISEPVMTVREITGRLEELDAALRLVESEGRGLEEKIRKDTDDAMDDDKDSRMVQWFALVKRRNELIREESHLMYRRRQQELEELHEELEYQLRPLLEKSDARKTTKEKQDEERLLEELLEVVSLRNNIVDSIEVDRLRYIEEDRKIENMMVESGLSQGRTDTAATKGRKKKEHTPTKKHDKSSYKAKSKK